MNPLQVTEEMQVSTRLQIALASPTAFALIIKAEKYSPDIKYNLYI